MNKIKKFFGKIWSVLKPIFTSLFSNKNAYNNAKEKAWYWAVPLGLISIVLSLIPILVTNLNVGGATIFNSSVSYKNSVSISVRTFYMDEAMKDFVETLEDKGIVIQVEKDSKNRKMATINDQTKWDNAFNMNKNNRYEYYTNDSIRRLEIYFTDYEGQDFTTYLNDIYSNKNPSDGDPTSSIKTTSFLLLGKYEIAFVLCNNQTPVAVRQGDYSYLDEGWTFKKLLDKTADLSDQQKINDQIFENFKTFLNKIYESPRLTKAWTTTGIIAGINVGITFILGFLLWILTRGKTNPFRTITFWETQKISYWCALTPAILTLGLGFLLSTYAVIMYVGFLGLRVTFLAMKTLRPTE